MTFTRQVLPDLATGLTQVKFDGGTCALVASRRGVSVTGELTITDISDLREFARVMTDAWKEHRKLMPNLKANLAGH
jgi:hypothetical protein